MLKYWIITINFWHFIYLAHNIIYIYGLFSSDTTKICLRFPEDEEFLVTILLSSLLIKYGLETNFEDFVFSNPE